MMMKNIVCSVISLLLIIACGQSYEEQKRMSRAERIRLAREDSAALKVAVMPTLDCLPMYVARQYGLYEQLGVDVRLKYYTAQMDCDTAIVNRRVEGTVTDVVRAQRIAAAAIPLTYVAATGAYWQLISNKNARIKNLKQFDDKMIAMSRLSATDLLSDYVADSVGLSDERVFKVQINDVNIRLKMLENNMMDALWLAEPQATAARMARHRVVLDSRKLDMWLGVIAFRKELLADTARKKQVDVFVKAYNMACDSINRHGIRKYDKLISKYCGVSGDVVLSIPENIKYNHAAVPRNRDTEIADKWLKTKEEHNGKE